LAIIILIITINNIINIDIKNQRWFILSRKKEQEIIRCSSSLRFLRDDGKMREANYERKSRGNSKYIIEPELEEIETVVLTV
jgi:hypothetical protein